MRLKDKLALLSRRGEDAVAQRSEHTLREQIVGPCPTDESDGEAARRERIARLRSLIGEVADRARHTGQTGARAARRERGPRSLPVGELRETQHGPLHLIETYLAPDHCHGRVEVRGAPSVDPALVARLALDPTLEGVDLSRMLLLDTETTGLAGGTGTVPFLIGLAFFEEGVLKVEQLFLRELGRERPMLGYLAERVTRASCVVSYNGKAFDWPLLRTRSILNRVPLAEPPAHLDLLHCARRLLKAKLESVRLCEVERELLGHYREDDVHGSAIPLFYLDYLRGGAVEPLLAVLEHNASDLIGLAAILPRMVSHFAEVHEGDDPIAHLAYAKVALRARDYERAEAFARATVDGGGADALARQAHEVLASSSRKRGDAAGAVAELTLCLERTRDPGQAAAVHHALAKLYEHALKDHRAAHRHAVHTLDAEGPDAHGRRLGRLRRKLLASC